MVRHQGLRKESDMKNMIGRDTEILNASLKITDAKLTTKSYMNTEASGGTLDGFTDGFTFRFRTTGGNKVGLDKNGNVVAGGN